MMEEFIKYWRQYLDQWNKIQGIYLKIYEKHKEDLKNIIENELIVSFIKFWKLLDNKCYDLKQLYQNTADGFKEFEKQIQSDEE